MEFFSVALLFVLGVSALLLLLRTKSRSKGMPPGPRGLPLIGSILHVASDPPKVFAKWSQEYGDTIAVKLGSQTMVIMHDYETAKAVMNEENVAGRDQTFEQAKINDNNGLIFSEGETWKVHRRFAISSLRDLGMGKNWFEDAILEEISELITVIKSHAGKPFGPAVNVQLGVSNVICALIFGKRFEHSDAQYQKLLRILSESMHLLPALTLLQYFPMLRYIPFGKLHNALKEFYVNDRTQSEFIQSLVNEKGRGTSTDESAAAADYITRFDSEKRKKAVANLSSFTDSQLTNSVRDLFGAGLETTSTTLQWAFVYMVEYPEIQRKVQEEIESKIGTRQIRMADKALLKYTDAVTLEIQRLGSIAPIGVFRSNFKDMVIDGYKIPARTTVAMNIYAIHRNPKYWSHPNTLYPEHFLDKEGSIKIPKGFIPFGAGKRECLGEPLAKMEVFLFFANILQNFQIEAAKDLPRPSLDEYFVSVTRAPLPYKICFVPRQ